MHRFLSRSDESADLTRRATEFGDSPRILGEFLGQSPNFVALWAIALALCCFTPASLAQDPEKKVTAVHIQSPILIDGNLDEPEWSLAQPATDFVQQEPLMGEPSTERTEVRMLYDDENLYLGVYCFDSAGSEGITISDISRDYAPRETDTFTMVFDTFNDKRNSFIFGTNAGGAKRDGQTAGDSERRNYDWDTVWHVKTKITEQGWQAAIAIPFRSLRFREVEEQVWGGEFRPPNSPQERVHPLVTHTPASPNQPGFLGGGTQRSVRNSPGPQSLLETLPLGSRGSPRR